MYKCPLLLLSPFWQMPPWHQMVHATAILIEWQNFPVFCESAWCQIGKSMFLPTSLLLIVPMYYEVISRRWGDLVVIWLADDLVDYWWCYQLMSLVEISNLQQQGSHLPWHWSIDEANTNKVDVHINMWDSVLFGDCHIWAFGYCNGCFGHIKCNN